MKNSVKKTLSFVLSLILIFGTVSAATTVLAAEASEQQSRSAYFNSALSGYLKGIVDVDGAVSIKEKEEFEEKTAQKSSSAKSFSMYSASSVQNNVKSDEPDASQDHTKLTLELEDGKNVAYLFSEPISFTDSDGNLVYKDTNIRQIADEKLLSEGYTYENGENDCRMYFSADSSKGVKLVLDDGSEVRIVTDSNVHGKTTKTISDNRQTDAFTYTGAYGEDTALRFLPQLNGIKEEIILTKYHGISSFDLTVYTGANTAAINSKGEIEIISAETGEAVETFAAPFALDAENCEDPASGHYTDCTFSLKKIEDGKYVLTINVPKEFLESGTTVYPVTVDPASVQALVTNDSAIYSAESTVSHGANPTACFGKASQYGKGRAMYFFRIPEDIAKYAQITQAMLWLRETTGRTETMYVRPYLIKDAWANTVTWATQPPHYSTFSYPGKTDLTLGRKNINSKSTDNPDNPYWYAFNITAAVRAWTTGTNDKGLMFISEYEAADAAYLWRAFATKDHTTSSYRSYAVITYTNDTTAPTFSVSGNPTAWTKGDVTLTVTATDNVYGAAGVYQYSFDNGTTWQSGNTKKFTSNQTVQIKVKDRAGNISAAKAVAITKIDKTVPKATVKYSTTAATNQSVTATITISDNAALKNYKIGSAAAVAVTGTSKTVTKTYTANTTENIVVTDSVGNTCTVAISVKNIDKTPPDATISYSTTAPTNGNVTATINMTDNVGLKSCKIGAVAAAAVIGTAKTITKTYSANATEDIVITDTAGNSVTKTIKVGNIDKTKPTVNISYSTTNWTNQNVTVTFTLADNIGLKSYKIGTAAPVNISGKNLTVTKPYTENVKEDIVVYDTAGNSIVKTIEITKIDKTPPVISISYSPTDYTNKVVLAIGTFTDDMSIKYLQVDNNEKVDIDEAARAYIAENESEMTAEEIAAYTPPIVCFPYMSLFSENKSKTLTAWDSAGNKTTKTLTISNIDKIPPEIKCEYSETKLTKNPVTLTFHVSDEAGLQSYGLLNGRETPISGKEAEFTMTFDSNIEDIVCVSDILGNTSGYYVKINNIDSQAPQISVQCPTADWTTQKFQVAVALSDDQLLKSYRLDSGTEIALSGKEQTVLIDCDKLAGKTITVTDSVGRQNSYKFDKLFYDPDFPQITDVRISDTEWTSEAVTIGVAANDGISGLADEAYSFDGGASWQKSNSYAFEQNTQGIVIAVRDKAGNTSYYYKDENGRACYTDNVDDAAVINISNIDKTVPNTPAVCAENGTVNIFGTGAEFDEATESPERFEYKIGENGEWVKYEEPFELVNTADVTVYARAADEAGRMSEASAFTAESTLGEYTASYDDIALGEGVLPVGFFRTYSSKTGWFFSFEANIQTVFEPDSTTDVDHYVFTDFYGEKQYFFKNAEDKFVSVSGDELEMNVDGYAFRLNCGDLTCSFGADGKLAMIENGYISAVYTRTANNLFVEDQARNITAVRLNTDGKPDNIMISRYDAAALDVVNKYVQYQWTDGRLTKFTDTANIQHNYAYNEKGLMTGNETVTVDYSANGRVKRITQPNGAFVKYTYEDCAPSSDEKLSGNIGRAVVSDSKGVTDYLYYADGFTVTENLSNYSDKAVYDPANISNALTKDSFADTAYAVEYIKEETESDETQPGEAPDETHTEIEKDDPTPLYVKNDDGSHTFFKYDDKERVIASLKVKADALSVTEEITFEQAEAAASEKTTTVYVGAEDDNVAEVTTLKRNEGGEFVNSGRETYSYNKAGDIETYAVCEWLMNGWRQIYGEEYKYNAYGNNTEKSVTAYRNTQDAETGTLEQETVSKSITEFRYDVWNQCVGFSENPGTDNEKITATAYDTLGRVTLQTENDETVSYTYDRKGNVLTVVSSEGTTEYTYDENGTLTNRTNPNGATASYAYDDLGNLTSHSFNGYSFTYNTLGSILTAKTGEQLIAVYTYSANTQQNVLNAEFGNGQAVAYEYDGDNRLLNVRQGMDGKYGYSYAKDDKGEVTATTITDAVNSLVKVIEDDKTTVKTADDVLLYSVETHFRDDKAENSFDGRTVTVGGTSYTLMQNEKSDEFKIGETVDFSKNYAYNEDGELTGTSVGGVTAEIEYTTDKNVNSLKMLLNSSNSKTYSYTYDDGNIKTETVTTVSKGENGETVENTDTTEYTYDSKNQLVSAENGTTKFEYSYDERGNILSKREYAVTTDENGEKVYTSIDDDSYAYDEIRKDKLTSFNGQSIVYDEIGNPVNYMGTAMTWTMGRQLASFGSNTYRYDENGIRTSKTVGGVTTDYYLDGANIIYQTDGTNSLYFHYDRNDELIGFKYNGNNYFYIKNSMGDITEITDDVGNIVASYAYDPWGAVVSVDGNTEIGNLNPFRYRSYYYDSEIAMYYLQSRYYNPDVGRFINCDDVNYIGITESEVSYNPFAYCENNPVNKFDLVGHIAIEVGAAFLSAALYFAMAAAIISAVLCSYMSLYSFQSALSKSYNVFESPMYTNAYKLKLLGDLVRTYGKKAVKFVVTSITIGIADAKIKKYVKKNGKDQYWTATLKYNYVDIGRSISYSKAVQEVSKGRNVFTITSKMAYRLAKAAYANKKPVGPEIDAGKSKTPGYYYHYHIYGRKKPGHIWFLFF